MGIVQSSEDEPIDRAPDVKLDGLNRLLQTMGANLLQSQTLRAAVQGAEDEDFRSEAVKSADAMAAKVRTQARILNTVLVPPPGFSDYYEYVSLQVNGHSEADPAAL